MCTRFLCDWQSIDRVHAAHRVAGFKNRLESEEHAFIYRPFNRRAFFCSELPQNVVDDAFVGWRLLRLSARSFRNANADFYKIFCSYRPFDTLNAIVPAGGRTE